MLQGQRDLATVGRILLSELTPLVNAHQGVLYQLESEYDAGLRLLAAYADDVSRGHPERLRVGEGLIGQCAADRRRMLVTDVPADAPSIGSGTFRVLPSSIIVLPILFGEATKFSALALEADKTYEARARLGVTTSTGDAEGEIVERRPCNVHAQDLEPVLARFRGEIEQVPPMHSALKRDGRPLYALAREGRELDSDGMIEMLLGWVARYPIRWIEDPLAEDDEAGQIAFTRAASGVLVVGDDYLVTNAERIHRAADVGACNTALIKPNQAGTLTETKAAFDAARVAGWKTIVSARSGPPWTD